MITINAAVAAIMAVLPSAVVGFCFWLIERRIQASTEAEKSEREKRQREVDEREEIRKKHEILLLDGVNTSIKLAEATARAVQRIPDAKCNGDMHAALDVAAEYESRQNKFFSTQSINNMFDYL